MNIATPATWLRNLGLFSGQPTKRIPISRQRWGYQTETLEDRALLSATAIAPDTTPADVSIANARAAVAFPDVSGSWSVEVPGVGIGTATFSQNGPRVTANIDIPGIGEFTAKGRFSRANPHELKSNARVTIPEIGKVRVRMELAFTEEGSPTTFTGTAEAKGRGGFEETVPLVGTRLIVQTMATADTARASVTLPEVNGLWTVTVEQPGGVSGTSVLNINQQGVKGRTIVGTIDPVDGVSFSLRGRFKLGTTDVITGTAKLKGPDGIVYRAKFTVTLNNDASEFTGNAVVKNRGDDIGQLNLSGYAGVTLPIG